MFIVDKIIESREKNPIAIIKGLTLRIEADCNIDDLELIAKDKISQCMEEMAKRCDDTLKKKLSRSECTLKNGRILHLDGDKTYSEKANTYYKDLNLDAIVKNVKEIQQPVVVWQLLNRYKPDVIIITGHDGMLKNGNNYNDINNYRNSKYFAETTNTARKWSEDLVIFAGACQSYFEEIMQNGANFASSPGRVLIDFIDPLMVAKKVATSEDNRFITAHEIASNLREGSRALGGKGSKGKRKHVI